MIRTVTAVDIVPGHEGAWEKAWRALREAQQRLPAVCGSSRRVLVTPLRETEEERTWPGQIIADPDVAPQTPLPEPGEALEVERGKQHGVHEVGEEHGMSM